MYKLNFKNLKFLYSGYSSSVTCILQIFFPSVWLAFSFSFNSAFQRAGVFLFFETFLYSFLPALCDFQNPVPQSGIKHGSSAVKVLSSNHWTAREFVSSQSVSSVAQLCPTLCDPMDCCLPCFLTIHHQLPELAETHVHRVGDAIQPSIPLLSPFLMSSSSFIFF